jgi:hypothetical protein
MRHAAALVIHNKNNWPDRTRRRPAVGFADWWPGCAREMQEKLFIKYELGVRL